MNFYRVYILCILFFMQLNADILRLKNNTPFKLKLFISDQNSGMKPIIIEKKKIAYIRSDHTINRTIIAHIHAGFYHTKQHNTSISMSVNTDTLQHLTIPPAQDIEITAPRVPKSIALHAQASRTHVHDKPYITIPTGKQFQATFINTSSHSTLSIDTDKAHVMILPRTRKQITLTGTTLITVSTESSHHIMGNHIEVIPQPIGIIDRVSYKVGVHNPRWYIESPPSITLKKTV